MELSMETKMETGFSVGLYDLGLEQGAAVKTVSDPPLAGLATFKALRVQVPNNHILTQKPVLYNYYYPKPKYLIIGYLDPGNPVEWSKASRASVSRKTL